MVSDEYEIDPCDPPVSRRYDRCTADCTADCGHCKGAGPPVTHRARIEVKVEYDHENGELNFTEGTFRQITKVRARFEEEVFRRAVIIELERLGYTVTPPKSPQIGGHHWDPSSGACNECEANASWCDNPPIYEEPK